MAHDYECQRCHCSLDAGEGRYCDECREEMRQEEQQRRFYNMSRQDQLEVQRFLEIRGA